MTRRTIIGKLLAALGATFLVGKITATKPPVPGEIEARQSKHSLTITFNDGSPPLEGVAAVEFIKRQIQEGEYELSEHLLAVEVAESENTDGPWRKVAFISRLPNEAASANP